MEFGHEARRKANTGGAPSWDDPTGSGESSLWAAMAVRLWQIEAGRVERAGCQAGDSKEQAELFFFFVSEETLVPEIWFLLGLAAGDKVPSMRNGLFLWLGATEQYMHVQLPKPPTSADPLPPFSPPDTHALPGHYALVRWVFCALVPAHTFRIRSSRQKQISPQRYMLLQRLRHNGTIQDSFYRRDPLIFLSLTHSMGWGIC